jgi:hypothetical protein
MKDYVCLARLLSGGGRVIDMIVILIVKGLGNHRPDSGLTTLVMSGICYHDLMRATKSC